jgi:ankyrin repeat protein
MSRCQGWTALHTSSNNGRIDVVKLLIAAKAYLNSVNKVRRAVSFAGVCDLDV